MRTRLFLSFFLVVLVSIASLVFLVRWGAAYEVRAYMFRGGMAGVDDLANTLEDYYRAHQGWEGVQSVLLATGQGMGGRRYGRTNGATAEPGFTGPGMMAGMMGRGMNQRLRLADAQGRLVGDTDQAQPAGSLTTLEMAQAIVLRSGQQVVGYLLPEGGMAFTRADQTFLLNRLSRAALFAAGGALVLSLLLSLLLGYRLLQPVRALTRAANRMAGGDLTQRVQVHGHDELAQLGETFNHMAASLQQAGETRRAMTADIAHELRTPLAVQRANLEALQDGVYPLSKENLAPILEQNLLLTRLVDDLRTLALADAGQLDLDLQPTDLPRLAQGVVEQFAPQADMSQVVINLDAPQSCPPILADPARLRQILVNLLSNALRYTPAGGRIEVEIHCGREMLQLVVHDSGPGIQPEALPLVFERFYRGDRARNRSEGGSGLGLAIARQLAEAQGGALAAANHPQGGAIFTLTLPYSSSKSNHDQE